MPDFKPSLGLLRMTKMSYETEYKELYSILINYSEEYLTDMSPEILNEIIFAILHDFPEIFWFEGKWRYEITNVGKKCLHPIYNMDRTEIKKVQQEISNLRQTFDNIYVGMDDTKIAQSLYQWIIQNVEYGINLSPRQNEYNGQNIYDTLIKRKAVCKGIAKAYQLMLSWYGISSALAIGYINGIGRHVWNVIKIDGKFYNVDICMEYEQLNIIFNKSKRKSFKGFMLSDRQISDTHIWDTNYPYRIKCCYEVETNEFN